MPAVAQMPEGGGPTGRLPRAASGVEIRVSLLWFNFWAFAWMKATKNTRDSALIRVLNRPRVSDWSSNNQIFSEFLMFGGHL